jgi:membrane protein YdbS with pleckstrin-like domain
LAVSAITQAFFAGRRRAQTVLGDADRVCLDERPHAVVLALPFLKAGVVGAVGAGLALVGWPVSVLGAALLAVAAAIAVRAAWRWERTRVQVTTEALVVVHGTVRRRSAAVLLSRIGPVELEQTLVGRLFGYGTVVAGELEIPYVPRPQRVVGLVDRLARR